MTLWGRNSQGQYVRNVGYDEGRSNNELWRTLREHRPYPASPAACLRLVTTLATTADFIMPGSGGPGSFVNDQFSRLIPTALPPDAAPTPDTFFAVLAELQPAFAHEPTAALLPGLAGLARQTHPDRDAFRASATRLNELPPGDLHQTARAALDLAQARRPKAPHDIPARTDPKLHVLDTYLSAAARNDTLSPSLRLGLLRDVLASVDPRALPDACVAAAQRLANPTPRGWGYRHYGLADPEVDRTLAPLIRAAFTLPPGPHDTPIIKAYVDWAAREHVEPGLIPNVDRPAVPRPGRLRVPPDGLTRPRPAGPGPRSANSATP